MAISNSGYAAKTWARRSALGAAIAAVLASGVPAQERTLTVLGTELHMVNLKAEGTAKGGVDVTKEFEAATGARINFVKETGPALNAALNRIGILSKSSEDLIYVLDMDLNSRSGGFFESLDPFLQSAPIDGFPGAWPANFMQANRINGHLRVFPVRCGTFGLWYNKALFAERGISGPPKTPEELHEIARKLTFTRPNGQKVYGFVSRGGRLDTDDVANMVRMFGGDLIAPNMEVVINKPEAVRGITMLRDMYREGLMPPNWASLGGSDLIQLFGDAQVAMSTGGTNYGPRFNNGRSAASGNAELTYLPLVKSLQTPEKPYSDSIIFTWNIGILQGAANKPLAYDFIRHLARLDVQREMARNENGPCSLTILDELAARDPAMAITRDLLKISRAPVPGHVRMPQARDMIGETIQNIVVKNLDVQRELDALADRLKRILR